MFTTKAVADAIPFDVATSETGVVNGSVVLYCSWRGCPCAGEPSVTCVGLDEPTIVTAGVPFGLGLERPYTWTLMPLPYWSGPTIVTPSASCADT